MLGQILTDPMGNPIPDDSGESDTPSAMVPGVTPPGPLSVDYYRAKLAEFQSMMVALDQTATAARNILPLAQEAASVNDDLARLQDDILASLAEFDAKKGSFKTAAEALNFAINGVNVFGANLPNLRVPSGLGVLPLPSPVGWQWLLQPLPAHRRWQQQRQRAARPDPRALAGSAGSRQRRSPR